MSSSKEVAAAAVALTPEQILGVNDFAVQAVPCPEWGGTVYIRTISADERDTFEYNATQVEDRRGTRAALVALAMCDADGKPMKVTPAQVQALGRKASGPMDRIFTAVLKLNKMRTADAEALVKN